LTTLDALQVALEGEHAALYVYGVLGAQTSASKSPQLYAAVSEGYETHRARRDDLTDLVLEAGGTPVASEQAYEIPRRLGTSELVARAALDLERRCATTYGWLVGNTVGSKRRWAVDALTDAAVRELTFRGSPETFPGGYEPADRG
jgi:threonine dehydrogenase-like Zn-dependent dehydrogenase